MKLTVSRYYLIHSPRELKFCEIPEVYFYKFSCWYSNTLNCYCYDVTLNVPCTPKLIKDMIYDYNDYIQIFLIRKVHIYGN